MNLDENRHRCKLPKQKNMRIEQLICKWVSILPNIGTLNLSTKRCGNVYYAEDSIYSYGSHFPLARYLPSGIVMLTDQIYSNSTSRHRSILEEALF